MNYIDKNDYIINCAYDAIGRDEMKRFFYSDFIDIISTIINEADKTRERHLDPEFKNFLANFYTEALAGTLLDWAKEKNGRNKEKTYCIYRRRRRNGAGLSTGEMAQRTWRGL